MSHPEWALIIGGADCIWDDVCAWEKVYGPQWDGLVIAANDIGAHWPGELDAWVSLHATKFNRWKEVREYNRFPPLRGQTWGKLEHIAYTDKAVRPWAGGSSGMLAVQVAKELGCTKAILCGVPMTPTAHFAETQEKFHEKWLQSNAHWRAWPKQADRMLGWVKSMSGRTQELLGSPTIDWLLE